MKLLPNRLLLLLFLLVNNIILAENVEQIIAYKTWEWNEAHNEQSISKLKDLYSFAVIGYGKPCTRSEFLTKKENLFAKFENFHQTIDPKFKISYYENGLIKCEFSKKAKALKPPYRLKTYPSYLVYKLVDGYYKIVEEGDEITNYNLNYHPRLGKETVQAKVEILNVKKDTNWGFILMISLSFLSLIYIIYYLFFKKTKKYSTQSNSQPNKIVLPANNIVSESETKGRLFENYIVERFRKQYFKIMIWQSDKCVNGRYALNSLNPDLVMHLKYSDVSKELAVECKYRSMIDTNNMVEYCTKQQLKNYQKFGKDNQLDVFLALGVAGSPDNPRELYIIPINNMSANCLSYKELKIYAQKPPFGNFFYNYEKGTLTLYSLRSEY